MAAESEFVTVAQEVAESVLPLPLFVQRGAALLYQVTVDNQLSLTANVKRQVRELRIPNITAIHALAACQWKESSG